MLPTFVSSCCMNVLIGNAPRCPSSVFSSPDVCLAIVSINGEAITVIAGLQTLPETSVRFVSSVCINYHQSYKFYKRKLRIYWRLINLEVLRLQQILVTMTLQSFLLFSSLMKLKLLIFLFVALLFKLYIIHLSLSDRK